ncbi:NADH-quinone oxidoreductase subunit L [Candidatus Ishikawella capsulata]|uniref:NADH:ubiquinone oxidoreductase chain L n=1 Tax=Candidatus Ishikawaella capsulata Mpkobe TaxID=476281 RepID=C5WC68_9ENTR|nr:NADH-quinone oxidoreductase subunit L [Candidatus Ishikawaella capsulata]BAH82924.1 NADH:ubiquinone oxidoreductase chain L [Candidatus Ishikawaella capsulata Mpkobe]
MNFLYLIIVFPLISFIILSLSLGRLSDKISAIIGITSIALSTLVTIVISIIFFQQGQQIFVQRLWTWINLGSFNIKVSLLLDGFSLTMLWIVTGVGLLIQIFSSWYMYADGEIGYSRFFAYNNLFIASMVLLILADNLLLMYVGWEAVGICSYLLIVFYYKRYFNCRAAIKAFTMTRIGDVFLAVGMFIIYDKLGTLNFNEIITQAHIHFIKDSYLLTLVTSMLLLGAIGKSAQLPLQTWLPDAMVGPTPVSALIHAATMITAGVYLIARTHALFVMTSGVLYVVGIIGAISILIASFAALVQTDVKLILAYSTISQIGYMFVSLGIQAWNAAVFHLIMHAFFKALLFLAAGSLILSYNHKQDMSEMGGLRKDLPLVYACFLIGGGSLCGFPIITGGFYSKDQIILCALSSGHFLFTAICLIGSFITTLYTFRMIFTVFHGKQQKIPRIPIGTGITHSIPLIILLLLSTFLGTFITPPLTNVLPPDNPIEKNRFIVEVISGIITIFGIFIAAILWLGNDKLVVNYINKTKLGKNVNSYLLKGWGFDYIYNKVFVEPYFSMVKFIKDDPISKIMNILIVICQLSNKTLSISSNGLLRWYMASIGLGAIMVLATLLLFK